MSRVAPGVACIVAATLPACVNDPSDELDDNTNAYTIAAQAGRCVQVQEPNGARLSCPEGERIVSIDFASYGLPEGSCDSELDVGACHSDSSTAVLEARCLGDNWCHVPATNKQFGNPCQDERKRLAVVYSCSGDRPVPSIAASGDNGAKGEGKEMAFDGDATTKWLTFQDACWIQYDFAGDERKAVNRYTIRSANDHPERDPRDWRLLGSNDGAQWVALDTRAGQTFTQRFQARSYSFANDTPYAMYRLRILSNRDPAAANSTQLSELELSDDGDGDTAGECVGPRLNPDDTALAGQFLCSHNGQYRFGVVPSTGDLALLDGDRPVWTAGISGGGTLRMHRNNNLTVYDRSGQTTSEHVLWVSRTRDPDDLRATTLYVRDRGVAELLENGQSTTWSTEGVPQPPPPPPSSYGDLKIVIFSVGSADATLIVFPNGKTMMVDSGTERRFRDRVLPFLQRHDITHLDYYFETHGHADHTGGRATLEQRGYIDDATVYRTNKTFDYQDRLTLEGTDWFIYNAHDRDRYGSDANPNSLSFTMTYNGFVYSATGDEDHRSQNRFLRDHPNRVRAHVRNTAHHMWGPVSRDFLVATDPFLFVISCSADIRQWRDFRDDFLWAFNRLANNGGRDNEYVITAESRHVFIRASSDSDWDYSFCDNLNTCTFPALR